MYLSMKKNIEIKMKRKINSIYLTQVGKKTKTIYTLYLVGGVRHDGKAKANSKT